MIYVTALYCYTQSDTVMYIAGLTGGVRLVYLALDAGAPAAAFAEACLMHVRRAAVRCATPGVHAAGESSLSLIHVLCAHGVA